MSRSLRRKIIFRTYFEYLLIAVFLALLIRFVVISPFKMPSDSMAPALIEGDFVFAYKLPYGIRLPFSNKKMGRSVLPKVRDIVLYKYELDKQSLFIKRVMALPGDRVEIIDGKLLVNGNPAMSLPNDVKLDPFLVPSDSVFLIGDNAQKSDDLQYWSVISKERILGRIHWIWLSVDQTVNKIRWDRILKVVH